MSHSIKIVSIKPDSNQETGERFLDVEAQILDESGEVATTKRLGYPIDTTEDFIREDLSKVLSTYVAEVDFNNSAAGEQAKQVEQENKHADDIAQSLVGEEIKK